MNLGFPVRETWIPDSKAKDSGFHEQKLPGFRNPESGLPYMRRSLYVSQKLPTYPSPKPTFFPKREVGVNVGIGEG